LKDEDNFLIESPIFSTVVAAPVGTEYVFEGVDFLFDTQEVNSLYQDAFKEIAVSTNNDKIGYVSDVALPTEE